MSRLAELFRDLKNNKTNYLGSREGSEFEDRINAKLHTLGYSRLIRTDITEKGFALLKKLVLDKETNHVPQNPFSVKFHRHFFHQPYGPQEYPDFLILDGDGVVSIETKYSKNKQGKPMWNSGLPRPNGIYVFGSYGRKDITFFRGADVVPKEDVRKLRDFFDKGLSEYQQRFNSDEMKEQAYGFSVYIRRAFDQNKKYNPDAVVDFFENPWRAELEDAVIDRFG